MEQNYYYIAIYNMKVDNAMASSNYNIVGAPGPTAALGMSDALRRNLSRDYNIAFQVKSVGIVYNDFHLYANKNPQEKFYSASLKRAPRILENEKECKTKDASITEYFICKLDISLLLKVSGEEVLAAQLPMLIKSELNVMRFAGGIISSVGEVSRPIYITENVESDEETELMHSFFPGYALIDRSDLLREEGREGKDRLDSIIDSQCLYAHVDAEGKRAYRPFVKGWIIPVQAGYKALSDFCEVRYQRDYNRKHRFAESVMTLAECKRVHRLSSVEDMMWHYDFNEELGLYAACGSKFKAE